jgi:hypothetical protein
MLIEKYMNNESWKFDERSAAIGGFVALVIWILLTMTNIIG